jgi:hypothetical protein
MTIFGILHNFRIFFIGKGLRRLEKFLPFYFRIITSYLKMSGIPFMGDRLKNRYYCHKKLFMADINRIFTNCRSYNKPDTEYYKCANVTEKFFLTKWKDAGLGEKT